MAVGAGIFVSNSLRKAAYHYRRLSWCMSPRFYLQKPVTIDSPIFLLGNQGGGLSFLSRVLRKNSHVVSCTGNNEYWTGADEIQRVFEWALPWEFRLSGQVLGNRDPDDPSLPLPRGWSYACDRMLEHYFCDENHITDKDSSELKKVLSFCLSRYGRVERPRFIDKSQVYTIRTRAIQKALKGSHPHFLFVTRDPVVSVFRAATGSAGDIARSSLSFEEKIDVCAEHWRNSTRIVLRDAEYLDHFKWIQFEDFLNDPGRKVREICEFLDLEFDAEMLPQSYHKIPFATRYLDRWWPMRPSVNKKYQCPPDVAKHIWDILGDVAGDVGYEFHY